LTGICEGRVVVITGAGGGLGRQYALEYARQGARIVVNDLGSAPNGTGSSPGPAHEVAAEVRALGAEAVANSDDVADWDGGARLIGAAIRAFGRLDVLVNNAAVLRDRMLVSMTLDDWQTVMRVDLQGTFVPTRHAADYWRGRAKAGDNVDARIINTTSLSGLAANVGQGNYGAAKAGVAAFTIIAARELTRYGVTVNAVCPSGLTRLTSGGLRNRARAAADSENGFDPYDPANVAPLVTWLGSAAARDVTGQVFRVRGGTITVLEGWTRGPHAHRESRWDPVELSAVVPALVADAAPPGTVADDQDFHSSLSL
jgi:NAD(P)-dependent dehydrogenase (short-subunit alcohol dehydrogenase family)